MTGFLYDDGGRGAAGFRGTTEDCVCRAIAIVTGLPYREVYDMIIRYAADERPRRGKDRSHPRKGGVAMPTVHRLMGDLGWCWVPTMGIGTGCRVHLDPDELPDVEALMVRVSKHVTTLVRGVVRDTYDPSRGGTRCVYGYWIRKEDQ